MSHPLDYTPPDCRCNQATKWWGRQDKGHGDYCRQAPKPTTSEPAYRLNRERRRPT